MLYRVLIIMHNNHVTNYQILLRYSICKTVIGNLYDRIFIPVLSGFILEFRFILDTKNMPALYWQRILLMNKLDKKPDMKYRHISFDASKCSLVSFCRLKL